ncbi:Glycosyltransferase [Heracleum sosnowskyi]|uniref:Glycosyltransferase n=1 Tax=Heracleum sosnowskyi TaxID=360622 RepID=A0AAD8IQT5_9APIA|nr:Glycosyltransferase [Heracleum sosnowskyi]
MEQSPRPAHCLVFPYPMQGHINPMHQFSKTLVSKGIKVTLVTTKFLSKSFQQLSGSMPVETISDGFEGGYASAESLEAYFSKFKKIGSETLTKLIEKLNATGFPVDCIVYDAMMTWVLDVVKSFGLVSAIFFTQSCAVDNIYYHVKKGLINVPVENRVSLSGLSVLEPLDMPSFVHNPGLYPGLLDIMVNQFSDIDKVDWVLCNTFYKLEEEVIEWMSKQLRLRAIGPTILRKCLNNQKTREDDTDNGLQMFKPNTDAYMNWLNEQQDHSVIYVSFGSLAELNAEQMQELAYGIKQSGKHFLWVVRASEEGKLPKGFVEETSAKGIVVQWCSQMEVLAHKALGCFVTHCGWNSTLEALCLGVPMVAVPIWTDQRTNAKFVADVWRMGVRVDTDKNGVFKGEIVGHCIREVMDGEKGKEVKTTSKKWMDMAREAVKEGGSSDISINEFVASLTQHYKS